MQKLFVANWKMYMNFKSSTSYCIENVVALNALANKNTTIIICPSFIALGPVASTLKTSLIAIGAQDCSAFDNGPYTSQVAAQSLAEVGCSYCIVGHSEQRAYYGETNEAIAEKIKQLLRHNITPIMCIGETDTDCILSRTYTALEQQLNGLFLALTLYKQKNITPIIAYEPVWAIGTGTIPQKEYLENIFDWLHKKFLEKAPCCKPIFLYGGSVNKDNIILLNEIDHLNGFLIGKKSTNFIEFQAIINSCNRSIL